MWRIDPDPGSEKIRYGSRSRSRANFDTDPDRILAKTIRIRTQQKRIKYQEILWNVIKHRSYPMFCECKLLNIHFSINNHLNLGKRLKLFTVFHGFSRIRIQPISDTDLDPGKWYGFHGPDPDPPHCRPVSLKQFKQNIFDTFELWIYSLPTVVKIYIFTLYCRYSLQRDFRNKQK